MRLPDPEGGYLPPSAFVPLAEELQLIGDVGAIVLKQAMAFAATWPDHLYVSINLSPRQFSPEENDGQPISELIAWMLEHTGIAPHRVTLEITEGALLVDTEAVLSQLRQLHSLGVKTSLDDFGSGYSSLNYLWQFNFDTLKIDQSFVRGMRTNRANLGMIVQSIVSLSRSLGLKVVAEGIEHREEAAFFLNAGCDAFQGYLYGKPMPRLEAEQMIAADLAREAVSGGEDHLRVVGGQM